MPTGYVDIEDVWVIHETSHGYTDRGAILVMIEDEEVWIPKAMIHNDSEVYQMGTSGTLIVPLWFAEKKGLS